MSLGIPSEAASKIQNKNCINIHTDKHPYCIKDMRVAYVFARKARTHLWVPSLSLSHFSGSLGSL